MRRKVIVVFVTVFSVLFMSCDTQSEPEILGCASIEESIDGSLVCPINNLTLYYVDSVLTISDGVMVYRKPRRGELVTAFTFDIKDGVYFCSGYVTQDDLRPLFLSDEDSCEAMNFLFFFAAIIVWYLIIRYLLCKIQN